MIGLIAALDLDGLIGFDGTIPWKKPADMKRFRQLTLGTTIIMGRKTYESIGKPLAGRENVVLTSNAEAMGTVHSQVKLHHDLYGLLVDLKSNNKDAWIIGGSKVYEQALRTDLVDFLDITILNYRWSGTKMSEEEWASCATYFPKLPFNYTIVKEEVNPEDPTLLHRRYEPAIW